MSVRSTSRCIINSEVHGVLVLPRIGAQVWPALSTVARHVFNDEAI